jgi:hypothetical protein
MSAPSDPATSSGGRPTTRRATWYQAVGRLASAVRDADESEIERAVSQLGESRRWLAPLSYVAGGFGLVLDGVKLLFLNWRLTLIEVLPAVWIWLTFWDLKAHFLKGRSFTIVRGPLALAVAAVVVLVTVGAYFCNAVFAFSVAGDRPPRIRPAAAQARTHWRLILGWGVAVGLGHAVATIFVARAGVGWFTIALGLVLLVMMTSFVSVPAQIIGIEKSKQPLKAKIGAGAASGALSAVLTSPGFVCNRLGLLMAGTSILRIPGIIVFSIGVALQAAATSGSKAVKLGTKFGGTNMATTTPGPVTEPGTTDDMEDAGHG